MKYTTEFDMDYWVDEEGKHYQELPFRSEAIARFTLTGWKEELHLNDYYQIHREDGPAYIASRESRKATEHHYYWKNALILFSLENSVR